MNDHQQRYLVVSFRRIDQLLGEAGHILTTADSASPFAQYTQDSSPVQRKVIDDYIQDVGRVMARVMADLKLPRPAPVCNALWAAETRVTMARVATAEIRPKSLRGYGPLSETDSQRIDGIVAELDAALERLLSYLAQGSDADLPARLRKLEQTRDEAPLLRELERIITAHGLVALRATLSLLLDRMESDDFEVGVFGRVSSGKSSLLNHQLGAAVLPVGVTPVTAVPTRIRFGERARAMIELALNPALTVDLAQLAEFSTEQHNPGNQKRVTRIVVEVRAARLHQGITWVDTPGLGSLASGGAAGDHGLPATLRPRTGAGRCRGHADAGRSGAGANAVARRGQRDGAGEQGGFARAAGPAAFRGLRAATTRRSVRHGASGVSGQCRGGRC